MSAEVNSFRYHFDMYEIRYILTIQSDIHIALLYKYVIECVPDPLSRSTSS